MYRIVFHSIAFKMLVIHWTQLRWNMKGVGEEGTAK